MHLLIVLLNVWFHSSYSISGYHKANLKCPHVSVMLATDHCTLFTDQSFHFLLGSDTDEIIIILVLSCLNSWEKTSIYIFFAMLLDPKFRPFNEYYVILKLISSIINEDLYWHPVLFLPLLSTYRMNISAQCCWLHWHAHVLIHYCHAMPCNRRKKKKHTYYWKVCYVQCAICTADIRGRFKRMKTKQKTTKFK